MKFKGQLFIKISLFVGCSVIFSILAILLVLPTFLWVISGPGLFDQAFYSSVSPDGRLKLEISRRVDFPVSEMIDPSATVTLRLRSLDTDEITNTLVFRIYEYYDLRKPRIIWAGESVSVIDLVDGSHRSVDLPLPN